ncbi:hypothetical protein JCM10908_006333 [Rhodotorula pacifica]|uniref:uncharacterized protein n=1 Tax=Rhodotorula pacifica TaxID=1495444 RepID=UPI00316D74C5
MPPSTADMVANAPAPPPPRLTLLSLPDELLQRVFDHLPYNGWFDRGAWLNGYLLICRRITSCAQPIFVRRVWVPYDFAACDRFLSRMTLQPQRIRERIETLFIFVTPAWTEVHYAVLSHLPRLKELIIQFCTSEDENGAKLITSSLIRVLPHMRALQSLHFEEAAVSLVDFSSVMPNLARVSLPITAMNARMHLLQQNPVSDLCIHLSSGADEAALPAADLSDLPWSTLKRLELDFSLMPYDSIKKLCSLLADKSKNGLEATRMTSLVVHDVYESEDDDSASDEEGSPHAALLQDIAASFRHTSLWSLDVISSGAIALADLPRWTTLKRLRLDAYITFERRKRHHLRDLVNFLHHLPALTHLEIAARAFDPCECFALDSSLRLPVAVLPSTDVAAPPSAPSSAFSTKASRLNTTARRSFQTARISRARTMTSLLSLPDEILVRIFEQVCLEYHRDRPGRPPIRYLQICKRITAFLDRLWFRVICSRATHRATANLLAKLLIARPSVRESVLDLEIYINARTPYLAYASLVYLPNLKTLRLHLIDAQDDALTKSRDVMLTDMSLGLECLFGRCVNLRELEVTSLYLPAELFPLPTGLHRIAIDSGSLNAETAANLHQAGIAELDLNFKLEEMNQFGPLPWEHLQKLGLIFSFASQDAITACLDRLAQQSGNGEKATTLQALSVDLQAGLSDESAAILESVRQAFKHCEVPSLTFVSKETDLDIACEQEWPTLKHLSLHHYFQNFGEMLIESEQLTSLSLRGFNFAVCGCCYEGADHFIELDEDQWSFSGQLLLPLIHLVRHRTSICNLRLQIDDGRRELRWTRMSASDELVLERWTLV